MVWPTVEQYTKDAYALDFLSEILSSGKKAPMYRVLVKDKKLTSRASAYNRAQELAGSFRITINANAGISLAEVEDAIFESLQFLKRKGSQKKTWKGLKRDWKLSFITA